MTDPIRKAAVEIAAESAVLPDATPYTKLNADEVEAIIRKHLPDLSPLAAVERLAEKQKGATRGPCLKVSMPRNRFAVMSLNRTPRADEVASCGRETDAEFYALCSSTDFAALAAAAASLAALREANVKLREHEESIASSLSETVAERESLRSRLADAEREIESLKKAHLDEMALAEGRADSLAAAERERDEAREEIQRMTAPVEVGGGVAATLIATLRKNISDGIMAMPTYEQLSWPSVDFNTGEGLKSAIGTVTTSLALALAENGRMREAAKKLCHEAGAFVDGRDTYSNLAVALAEMSAALLGGGT